MRLQLATGGSTPGTPVSVGNSTDAVAGSTSGGAVWMNYNPATGTGVLNSAAISVPTATGTDYAFFTISPSNVVTAITATITDPLAAGSNSIALPASLAVNAGDYLGIWFVSGVAVNRATAAGFSAYRISSAIAKPSPGDTLTPSTLADNHWLISATT